MVNLSLEVPEAGADKLGCVRLTSVSPSLHLPLDVDEGFVAGGTGQGFMYKNFEDSQGDVIVFGSRHIP